MTPTEELIMETLVARARLGEPLWTFRSRHARAISSLQMKGYVWMTQGVVENTIRVGLTDFGREEFMSDDYRPPTPGLGIDEYFATVETALGWGSGC